jgi:GLPGLI family protein
MKKINFFILILILPINQIISQNKFVKITYKKNNHLLQNKKANPNTNGYKLRKKSDELMNIYEYVLLFDDTSSIFKEVPKLEFPSDANNLSIMLSSLFGDTDGVFYTERKSGKMFHQKESKSDIFLIEHPKINDWKLTQEKKKIGNYTCYKAIKKDSFISVSSGKKHYEVIAWYTTELPLPFGPIQYNGLPGVILELKNRKAIIYATKIEINPDKKIKIKKPKNGIAITKEEYDNVKLGLASKFNKRLKSGK